MTWMRCSGVVPIRREDGAVDYTFHTTKNERRQVMPIVVIHSIHPTKRHDS